MPEVLGLRMLVIQVPLMLAAPFPYFLAAADAAAEEIWAIVVAVIVVSIGAAFVGAVALVTLLRPVVLDAAMAVPAGAVRPPGRFNLDRRLWFFTAIGSLGAAIGAPTLALRAESRAGRWQLMTLYAIVVAGYVAAIGRAATRAWLRRPLEDLAEAAGRIGRGDLGTQVAITSADELGDLAAAFTGMVQGLREREALQAAFGSYVDPALAQRLLETGEAVFRGEELELSVLFADVRSFTSYSERVTPSESVALLNRLFELVVPVLRDHGGHANRYLGDGVLAVFGAPNPLQDHADSAIGAAVELQRAVRHTFGTELQLGIGINTGRVIAGTVGGGGRYEFTVIGDAVNVAARVEELTKVTGDAILLTEGTLADATAGRWNPIERGEFAIRGKASAVRVHSIDPFI